MKMRISVGYSQTDSYERPVRHISRYSGKRTVSVQHQKWLEESGIEIFQEPLMLSGPMFCSECRKLFDMRWHLESCKDHEGQKPLYDGKPLNTKTKFGAKKQKRTPRTSS